MSLVFLDEDIEMPHGAEDKIMTRVFSRCRPFLLGVFVSLALFLTGTTHAFAGGSDWRLIEKIGSVNIVTVGLVKIALTDGDVLQPGQRIETGPDGRAVIQRGQSFVTIAPRSVLVIPNDEPAGPYTRLMQYLGTIFVEVEKRPEEHFEVVTPYLAAVVKGTKFTVSVNESASVVHVTEGLVEVTDLATGELILLTPGQTAAVKEEGTGRGLDDPNALPTQLLDGQLVDSAGTLQNTNASTLISEVIGPGPLGSDLGLDGLVSLTSTTVTGLSEGVDVTGSLAEVQGPPDVDNLAVGDLGQGGDIGNLGSDLGGMDLLSNDPLAGGDVLGGSDLLGGGSLPGANGLPGGSNLPVVDNLLGS